MAKSVIGEACREAARKTDHKAAALAYFESIKKIKAWLQKTEEREDK